MKRFERLAATDKKIPKKLRDYLKEVPLGHLVDLEDPEYSAMEVDYVLVRESSDGEQSI